MSHQPTLFLVVLGGRTATCHVELHDVRWVVGTCIEDTIPALKREWFGLQKGLHVDSYKAITHVDGFAINMVPSAMAQVEPSKRDQSGPVDRLWFVNLGGYARNSLQEQHQFGLVVARSQQAAKARAKARWLKASLQVHKDDLHGIDSVGDVDDCLPIDGISGWRISLEFVPNAAETDLTPDWFGYWRIDGRLPKPRPEAVI
jgi:hypothetical protein